MRDRWKVLIIIIVLTIGTIAICYHPFMEAYDDYVDKWANPSYNGPFMSPEYSGGFFEYWVDTEFPYSKIVMIKNSTSRNYTRTTHLFTETNWEASIGGTDYWLVEEVHYGPDIYERVGYYIEWWILNYTIRVEDWLVEYWNGTHWIEDYAWFYEYNDLELVAELPMWEFPYESGLFNEQYNITLYADGHGWI